MKTFYHFFYAESSLKGSDFIRILLKDRKGTIIRSYNNILITDEEVKEQLRNKNRFFLDDGSQHKYIPSNMARKILPAS